MENKKENTYSKKFWYILIGICVTLIIIIAIGFIVFANRKEKVIVKEEFGGNIVLNYTDDITGLSLTKITPTTDQIGMKNMKEGQYFDFSINVDLDKAKSVEYEIAVIKESNNSTISDDDIRIYLEQEKSGTYTSVFEPAPYKALKKDTKLGSLSGSMVLTKVKRIKNSTDNYRLRMWLSNKSLTKSGDYSVEVIVNGRAK